MARTDTLGNFLTDVADAIRTKKGTQATIAAEDFDTEIENLPSGGGSSLKASVDSQFFNMSEVSNSTTTSLRCVVYGTDRNRVFQLIPKKGLVIGWVRSNYTLSNNLELIAETEWYASTDANQKLFVCWCDDLTQEFSVTQENSGRITLGYIVIKEGAKPTTAILNVTTPTGTANYTVQPTNKLCIYIASCIFAYSDSFVDLDQKFDTIVRNGQRTMYFASTDNRQKEVPLASGAESAIIGLEIEYEAEQNA